jgi:CBS domain-containing protein
MNVKAILAAKSRNLGGDVISIDLSADLTAAARLLGAHRIGAVVIRGVGGRLAGILSERDIVRAISGQGSEALALPVRQVMTRNVSTCVESDTIASVMERMTDGKFKHRVGEIEQESEALRDYIRTA